jgi:hypothetical protein
LKDGWMNFSTHPEWVIYLENGSEALILLLLHMIKQPTAWNRVLLDTPVRNFTAFLEPRTPLLCLQQLAC